MPIERNNNEFIPKRGHPMKYHKPTPSDLRKKNQAEILRKIYFEGPISRLEVSQQIGISPATVTNVVNDLLELGILVESGQKQSEAGRPSILLMINSLYGHFIGIEVGETFIQVELFNILLSMQQKAYFPLSTGRISLEQIVDLMVTGIEEVVTKAGLKIEDTIGVGIGFPGLVDPEAGVSVYTPNWGWHDVSITGLLGKRLSIPMFLDNGAKAMAMAEMLFGAGRGANNMAVLLVGTGVGSGIIADRVLFRGFANNAGEIGHTSLNIDGPRCRCGSQGCLEAYIGANSIIDYFQQISQDQTYLPTGNQIADLQSILSEYDLGKPEAIQTVNLTIRYLGVGIANLLNVFNPELVLIGGWSGLLLGNRFLPQIEEVVSKYALCQSLENNTIKLCELGQDAVARGAATLVLSHFFETAGKTKNVIVGGKAIGKASGR
jgi:predicted NBD/HSP70 family sugar kinase